MKIFHDSVIEQATPLTPPLALQLLGDYDKVKTFSSGSNCVCRCVVRPMRLVDCSQQESGPDHYTVETISEGSDCQRCECTAPPSALNPCEAERRLKRLQETSKDHQQVDTPHNTTQHFTAHYESGFINIKNHGT